MLYALLLLIAVLLVAYFGGRWLVGELREASGAVGTRLRILTGGLTSDHLLARTRRAVADHGLEPDCIILAGRVTPLYDALRRDVIGRPVAEALPAALVLAFAADVDARTLYLRTVEAPESGAPGRERQRLHAFDEIRAVAPGRNRFPGPLAAAGADALVIAVAGEAGGDCDLVLGPDLGVAPDDLATRVRAMIFRHERPAGAPVVVR